MKNCYAVLLAIALTSTVASAAEQGNVTGQMVINGKTIKLTHVYASAGPSRWDKKKVEIRVILSDVPLSDEDLASGSKREALANAGKLHAMELILADDPMGHPGKRAMSNDIYDSAFTTAQQPMRLSGLDTFETKTDDGKIIAGHHFMESRTSSATSATASVSGRRHVYGSGCAVGGGRGFLSGLMLCGNCSEKSQTPISNNSPAHGDNLI